MTPELLTCIYCGAQGRDVAMALIRHRDPTGRRFFSTDPRCRDHEACEKRARAANLPWPLAPDGKP